MSSGGNGRNFLLRKAASSCAGGLSANGSKTPNSGPRINPFDSQISHDTLHLPTFSPSVFSTVLSPSQESQHSSGRFWSVDQQAMLFPAQISEDSPWKQETATSRLDPETENKTQEAIDLYFSQHHKVTSPENDTTAGISQIVAINERSVAAMDESVLGGSPDLSRPKLSRSCNAGGTTATTTSTSPMKQPSADCHAQPASGDVSTNVTFASVQSEPNEPLSSSQVAGNQEPVKFSRWSQTTLSFPPNLPEEVEAVIAKFSNFHQCQENFSPVLAGNFPVSNAAAAPSGKQQQQPPAVNMRSFSRIQFLSATAGGAESHPIQDLSTNSSLRRKLFDGDQMDEDEDEDDEEEDDLKKRLSSPIPETSPASLHGDRVDGPVVGISPGAVLLTPKQGNCGSGGHFASPGLAIPWSVSPVTRKQKKTPSPQTKEDLVGPPKESSTPTKD